MKVDRLMTVVPVPAVETVVSSEPLASVVW